MVDAVNWNARIEDVVAGRWKDPQTGKAAVLPFEAIELAETTDGREADLIAPLRLGRRLAVVSDENTVEVMGRRVARALAAIATVDEVVLTGSLDCDEATIARVGALTRHADGVVAVGSGVLNDSCKHATFLDGRPYAVFGTAASMNGYGASTASVTLASGLKTSLPSHAPRGIFLDLGVSAAAPAWLSAAGLGDSLCRPTAQIDWWASHRLFGTFYSSTPYALQEGEEEPMIARAAGLAAHDLAAVGALQRVLTLCSMGVAFTQASHHGSMGEHQISHWVDMFAGEHHPGTTHGQQVGVASLVMARLQARILAMETPPVVKATRVDEAAMLRRYGPALGPLCIAEMRKTALDEAAAAAFNARLAAAWPTLRRELQAMALPAARMAEALRAAGGATTAAELGLPRPVWHDAIRHAREIRGRWSFVNLAADAGLLDEFLEDEY
ncbi:iron-containing alcohol dehydrogenase [Labrys wisconsinensis]|uniref:Glycerol-1-phosphate dehydrogenase [NAD(P)+] n=1 Tax=Labrys wisconsinensis TaxID=425677 RepID=A0ABU0JDY2_9HYPH|nr:iron-containing alcohol dehydrogenase [Labrys wisconsinensis]MDQ0472476.1 glycerol-1-phosphate dehydrogenase [NAD(P)+] [Labrys wisconsinensis]